MYNFSPEQGRSRSPDSWVEVNSRASTTSLPAIADDAASSAVSGSNDSHQRRRGRVTNPSPLHLQLPPRTSSAGGSSQEEYEESESESDRIMTSSNEGIQSSVSGSEHDAEDEEEDNAKDDDDDGRTALGAQSDQSCFTPQPNAFSHPPSSSSRHRQSVPGSYFPSTSRTTGSAQRNSYPGNQPRQIHNPFNTMSPAQQPDHDAALRASLSTLLSLGAAARGLPKQNQSSSRATGQHSSARLDPTTLRTVPESVALGLDRPSLQARRISSTPSSSNRAPSPALESFTTKAAQQKRKATRSSSKDRDRDRQRVAKKPRRMLAEDGISPTLLTWVVSAGVLVLVSALSFSAGYKIGKETGRLDAAFPGGESGSCAREVGRSGMGLRRLRWSSATSAVRV